MGGAILIIPPSPVTPDVRVCARAAAPSSVALMRAGELTRIRRGDRGAGEPLSCGGGW